MFGFSFSFLCLRAREYGSCGCLSAWTRCLQFSLWKTMHQSLARSKSCDNSSGMSWWRPLLAFHGSCSGADRNSKALSRPSAYLDPEPARFARILSGSCSRNLQILSSCSRLAPACPRRSAWLCPSLQSPLKPMSIASDFLSTRSHPPPSGYCSTQYHSMRASLASSYNLVHESR